MEKKGPSSPSPLRRPDSPRWTRSPSSLKTTKQRFPIYFSLVQSTPGFGVWVSTCPPWSSMLKIPLPRYIRAISSAG